jgi:hypothetical protein
LSHFFVSGFFYAAAAGLGASGFLSVFGAVAAGFGASGFLSVF